ncbi:MAG TPA: TetR/AcrR family transcriptional regulator [Jatrophihabitantaceae bacterium]|jgi:AcrR family transcriptional regulator
MTAAVGTKGDRQRRAIVDAVRQLLTEVPLAELSVGRITEAAYITRSGFYFYFDSKYEALAVALDDVWDELETSTHRFEPRAADESPVHYSRRMLAVAVDVWHHNAPLINALMLARETDPRLRQMWDDWMDLLVENLSVITSRERQAGNAKPAHDDTRELVRRLVGMSVWALHEDDLRAGADRHHTVEVLDAIWLAAAWGVTP